MLAYIVCGWLFLSLGLLTFESGIILKEELSGEDDLDF